MSAEEQRRQDSAHAVSQAQGQPVRQPVEQRTTPSGLAYAVSGPDDGRLIILVHGAMDRMAGMHKLARRFDDRFRVLRYDRRGYGASVPHDGPFGIEQQVDDLLELIDGAHAVVVGHSLGGDIALAAAQRARGQIDAVVAFEPPQSWEPWWPADGATAGGAALGVDPFDAAETFMRRLIGDRMWERLPQSTKDARRAEGPALVGELRSIRSGPPFEPSEIEQPVFFGCSELGRPHHQRGTSLLAEQVPNGTLVTIAQASHGAHASHPEQFAALLVWPALRAAGYA